MKKEFLPYIKLVDFLGTILGSNSEVVLHDMTDINSSIIAVSNNHVTGRKVGDPATDLSLRIMVDPKFEHQDYLSNYLSERKDGTKFRSSTLFIRNEKGKIIGMLCINSNCQSLLDSIDVLKSMTKIDTVLNLTNTNTAEAQSSVLENLNMSIDELTVQGIQMALDNIGISPEQMTQQDKISVVKKLYDDGIFLLKGTVAQVASVLKMSEPSIYRYLKQIKNGKVKNGTESKHPKTTG